MSESDLALTIPPELIDVIVERVLARLEERDTGFLSVEQAAEFLGKTRPALDQMKARGDIVPDGYLGRRPLYTRETLRVAVGCK